MAIRQSACITPLLRERINRQFLLGARNQALLTKYVAGMGTVKSLQMEPRLAARFGNHLATYLQAGFKTRQLANAYNVSASTLEQLLTLSILCVGAPEMRPSSRTLCHGNRGLSPIYSSANS